MESLHIRLKRIRLGMGLSQKDFAEQVGVCRETISRWESGKHKPQQICEDKLNEILDNYDKIIGLSDKF